MKKLDLSDVKNIYEHEKGRDAMLQRIIDLKRWRRLQLTPHLSLVFENRGTVLFQVQEMCRAERIVDAVRIQEQIDDYNDLIPSDRELSATLFIEVDDASHLKAILERYMGIDTGDHVRIEIGTEHTVSAQFEAGHSDEARGKLSAVHFLKFGFTLEQVRAFRDSEVHLVVDHSGARARVRLPEEGKASLLEDLFA